MPRKLKLVFLVAMLVTIGMIVFRSHISKDDSLDAFQDFYHKTKDALDTKKRPDGHAVVDSSGKVKGQVPIDKDADGDIDEDDQILASEMVESLKDAEKKAKQAAQAKAPNKPDVPGKVVGVGSSAEGQAKHVDKEDEKGGKSKAHEETEEEHKVEQEIKRILRQSPVIIFSKSYCPYSKRAKGVLLEKYAVEPAPYVVELDEHELGPQIQDALEVMTGRRTVPNIMVQGKSIGGSDDIADLDNKKLLIDKIKTLGGSRVEIKQRFTSTGGN